MDRIIIILPKFVGDSFNVIPSIDIIKKSYPDAEIHMFGSDPVTHLFSQRLDNVFDVEVSMRGSKFKRILLTISALKKLKADACILMTHTFRDALIAKLSNIPIIVGYASECRSFLLTKALKINKNRHYINKYAYLANELCQKKESLLPRSFFPTTPYALENVDTLNIGLVTGVHGPRKLPINKSVEILSLLACDFPSSNFYMLGNAQEEKDAELIKKSCGVGISQKTYNYANKTTLDQFVDIIGSIDLLISIDSSAIHIASYVDTPCVVLHSQGTSPFSLVCPKSETTKVVNSRWSHLKDEDQVVDLMPQDVVDAAHSLLNQFSTKHS